MMDIRLTWFVAFLAQLVERVTSNDEVTRSSRVGGTVQVKYDFSFYIIVILHN